MSQTHAIELLQAVREFLREEVLPQLSGFSAYNTRVAANSLQIIAREWQLQAGIEKLDTEMAQSLQLDETDNVSRQISLKLKNGAITPDEKLLDYLRQRSLQVLEIDNPKYSGYIQASKLWRAKPAG